MVIPQEEEIHRGAVVGRAQNQELALGQELELGPEPEPELEPGLEPGLELEQAWAALTRIIRSKELLPAGRQEEICRPS